MKWHQFMASVERQYWLKLISEQPNNSAVARAAGIERSRMYRRFAKVGIHRQAPHVGNVKWQELGA